MKEEEIINDIRTALVIWDSIAIKLRRVLIALGSIAIVCSLSVTAFIGSTWANDNVLRMLSLLAAISLTASTAFGISTKGNNARNAWRYLNKSILLYYAGKLTLEQLIKAKSDSEDLLGGVDFNGSGLGSPR